MEKIAIVGMSGRFPASELEAGGSEDARAPDYAALGILWFFQSCPKPREVLL